MKKRALHELVKKVMLSIPLGLAPLGCTGPFFPGSCPPDRPVEILGFFEDGGPVDFGSGLPENSLTDAGALPAGSCTVNCPANTHSCEHVTRPSPADAGQESLIACHTTVRCVGGRRPEGLVESTFAGASEAGRYLARMAHLEAASVPAFLRLADELAGLDAPESLVRAAREAACDEVFHARAVGALARRYGGEVSEPEVAPFRSRGLLALAEENAVEGCVGETFGALVAAWQAASAGDARVRGVMRAVAADELRHAELAWEVAAWADERLSPAERAQVAEARARAAQALLVEVGEGLGDEARLALGLPEPTQVLALVAEARRALWS